MTVTSSGRSTRQAIFAIGLGAVLLLVVFAGQIVGWWAVPDLESLSVLLEALIFLGLGSLILWRAGGNRVGWVFAYIGLSILASGVAAGLASRGIIVAEAIGGALWLSWVMAISLLIAWYPTGRVVSRRWLWLEWLGFAGLAAIFALYTFAEQLCVESVENVGCIQYAPNPIGISGMPNPEYGWISAPLFGVAFVVFISALVSLVVRYRSSTTMNRLQINWFLMATTLFVVSLGLSMFTEEVLGIQPVWISVLVEISTISIPVSATVAILRYRLYDIDRIISRTVTYAIVVGLLAGGVALLAAAIGTLFDNSLTVAATTLGVVAVFNPLRRRVQALVDRRFNRSRYDAERVMAEFSGSMRDLVDPEGILVGWISVVTSTMQPVSVGLWSRHHD